MMRWCGEHPLPPRPGNLFRGLPIGGCWDCCGVSRPGQPASSTAPNADPETIPSVAAFWPAHLPPRRAIPTVSLGVSGLRGQPTTAHSVAAAAGRYRWRRAAGCLSHDGMSADASVEAGAPRRRARRRAVGGEESCRMAEAPVSPALARLGAGAQAAEQRANCAPPRAPLPGGGGSPLPCGCWRRKRPSHPFLRG